MALPAVFAVMSSASRIETPEASSVDSVRQNRATAIFASGCQDQAAHDCVDSAAGVAKDA
jgi:hypothetical protein